MAALRNGGGFFIPKYQGIFIAPFSFCGGLKVMFIINFVLRNFLCSKLLTTPKLGSSSNQVGNECNELNLSLPAIRNAMVIRFRGFRYPPSPCLSSLNEAVDTFKEAGGQIAVKVAQDTAPVVFYGIRHFFY